MLSFILQTAQVLKEKITGVLHRYPYLLLWVVANPVASMLLYESASPPKGQAN